MKVIFIKLSSVRVQLKLAVTLDVAKLQRGDGSFMGDEWGEIDTRFSYCALSALSIIGHLEAVDVGKAAAFIDKCQNFDGGFGSMPGAESHAGQSMFFRVLLLNFVFCCLAALKIIDRIDLVNQDALGKWLADRQIKCGGLNGRPEKLEDVCYSWWVLSSLDIIQRIDWIDKDKLIDFILKCQVCLMNCCHDKYIDDCRMMKQEALPIDRVI